MQEQSVTGLAAQEETRPGAKDPSGGDSHRDALGMAPDSGRLPPLGHSRRPQPPPPPSQRSQRPDAGQVGVVGPHPPFGSHSYGPTSSSPYNQGSGFAGQYTLAPQPQMSQQSMSLVHSTPAPYFPGYGLPPDSSLMPQNIHANYPMMQHHGNMYTYQRQSPPESAQGTHTQYSGAGPSQVYSPQVNASPPPLSPSHSGSPTYSASGQFHSLRYSTLSNAQYGYPPPSFPASPNIYQSPPYNPGYPTYSPSGDTEAQQQGTWWFLPHAASSYDSGQPPYQYTMGYPPASLPTHDSDTPPYTQRHTPAPVLSSPSPLPLPTASSSSTVRSPASSNAVGSVSSPLALSASSHQSPKPESASGSSAYRFGSERAPVRRSYHPNPPAHRSEWVMWVGNVPSDATHEELWRFFNVPYRSGDNTTTGVMSIFPISRSNCAFVNYSGQGPLEDSIKRFNGKQLRPADARCPALVCRVRKVDDDLKAGVGAQRGMGMHTKWIRDQKGKLKAGPPSVTSATSTTSEDVPTTPSSASGDAITGMSNLSISSDEHTTAGLKGHSSSSGSYASTNSSLLTSHFPKRYFILKSLTQYDLDLSVETGVWATQKHNEGILDQAFRTSKDVYLIFGVNKSGEFYGYARMSGPVKGERKVSWASRAGDFSPTSSLPTTSRHATGEEGSAPSTLKSPVSNFLSPASGRMVDQSPQPLGEATRSPIIRVPHPVQSAPPEFGPRGQLSVSKHPIERHTHEEQTSPEFALDENAPKRAVRGPVSATTDPHMRPSGEREHSEPVMPSAISTPLRGDDNGREESWGESFKVEWQCTTRLPFFRTRHLRNPWNHDREVKVSRDGTELEPIVGQRLLDEWEQLANSTSPPPGNANPAAKDATTPPPQPPAPPKRTTTSAREPRRREAGGS